MHRQLCSKIRIGAVGSSDCWDDSPQLESTTEAYQLQTEQQRGASLVIVALAIVPLLAFVGLAIDSGNLYRSRLALQNAADAAALSTVSYAALAGRQTLDADAQVLPGDTLAVKNEKISTYLAPRATSVAHANLASAGLAHSDSGDYRVSFAGIYSAADPSRADNTAAFTYRVTVSRRIDYLFMDLLPIIGGSFSVLSATATSARKVANLSLILDLSRSMICPKNDPDCLCLKPGRGANTCVGDSKYELLLASILKFMQFFDLGVDRVSITPFNTASIAFTLEELGDVVEDYAGTKDPNLVMEFLRENFQPDGLTNICDAFIKSQDKMRNTVLTNNPDEGIAYFFFSDGAPTAGRFLFSQPKNIGPNQTAFGQYDYTSYALEWVSPDNRHRPGPSLLFKSQYLTFGDNQANPAPTADKVANCNLALGGAPMVTKDENQPYSPGLSSSDAAETIFGDCLNSLGSYLPGSQTEQFGTNYDFVPERTFGDWQEQYYNCAIRLSDNMRADNGTFYVAGYGRPPAVGTFLPTDPYADVTNSFSLKKGFLSRIAWDRRAFSSEPDFDFDGYSGKDSYNSQSFGVFQQADNAEDLQIIFEDMARAILLKLTN